jgi:hypothetical protein
VYVRRRFNAALTVLSAVGLGAVSVGLAFGVGLLPLARATAAPPESAVMLGIGDRVVGPGALSVTASDKLGVPSQTDSSALLANVARQPAPVLVPSSFGRGSSIVSRAAAGGWQSARVSWYGPGFYGRKTASGAVLTQDMMNVAHRSLALGTRIQFEYRGRTCVAVVNDRGPYVGGRTFDLGPGTAQTLGFSGVGTVRYRILGR